MSELGGWATETINSLAKLNEVELHASLVRILDGASRQECQALYDHIETTSYQMSKRVNVLKEMTRYNDIPPEDIIKQEQRAQRWARILEVARPYVQS